MYWKCPECSVINKLKQNSSEVCVCGFVPYNASDFISEFPVYVVKVSAPEKDNLTEIAAQLHGDVNCDLADITKRLATGTTFNASFAHKEAATQFADKYRCLNCNVQIVEQESQTKPTSTEEQMAEPKEQSRDIVEKIACPHCEELILPDITVCPYCAENVMSAPFVSDTTVGATTISPTNEECVIDNTIQETASSPIEIGPVKTRLKRLEALLAEGIITQEEFNSRKQQILDDYLNV